MDTKDYVKTREPKKLRAVPAFDATDPDNVPKDCDYLLRKLDDISQVDAAHKILLMRYCESSYHHQTLQRCAERILELYNIEVLQRLEKQDIQYGFSGTLPFYGFVWLQNSCEQVFVDYFIDSKLKDEMKKKQLHDAYALVAKSQKMKTKLYHQSNVT